MYRHRNAHKKHSIRWVLPLAAIIIAGAVLLYFQFAAASFQGNGGTAAWGDGNGIGRIRLSAYTFGSPGTFGTSFRPATAPSVSAIQFVETKTSPARNGQLVGYQLNNGSLYMALCSGSCSTGGDLNPNIWNTTIFGSNVITRGFDIAYEQKSGRAMVVYAGNTTGKLYYCIFDGTNWGPVSNCAPTNGTNDITLTDGTTTLSGTPEWVRLVPRGDQYTDYRTNDILLAVQDTNKNIFVQRWDGSAWNTTDRQVLTTTGGAQVATTDSGNVDSPAFDVGWESVSGTEMAIYANGTALSYRTSTGSGFGSATTITTLASAAQWVRVAGDPQSNRMSLITAFGSTGTIGSNATANPYIWKSDGSTVGWTLLTAKTMQQDAGQNISTAWEKSHTATPQALFSASSSTNNQQPAWSSWTQSGGQVAWASLTTTSGDIITDNELTPSPNSDIVNMMQADRDGRLRARTYDGSAWGALITTNLPTVLINTPTARALNKTYTQKAFQYAYTPYSAWSLNWRVYDDEGTAGPPGVALAPEGVTPQVTPNNIVRLRMNYAELSGNSEGDTRKKLQYSTGAGCPDSNACTWTDVGAQGSGSIWRYAAGGLSDNATLASTVLDGSTAAGYAVTNGTASASGDLHNAGDVQEYDYTIQNNGATLNATYYFRGYDYGPSLSGGSMTNLNAIPREQIFDINGTEATNCTANNTASTCTYPSMEPFNVAPQAPIIYAPLSGDTGVADSPVIQLRSFDQFANYIQYVIEYCPTNSWPCASGGGSFDQTASQNGWTNQDANGGTAYASSGVDVSNSSMGEYSVSPGTFQPNTTYYLRAKAIDPGGSGNFSSYSTTYNFTTGPTDVRIQGGTTINGGTVIQ